MPFVLALVASALIHAAALVGPGWELPGLGEPEPAPTIDAVLAKPAAPPKAPAPPTLSPAPMPKAKSLTPVPPPAPAPVATAPAAAPAAVSPAPTLAPPGTPPNRPAHAPPATPQPVAIPLPAKGRARFLVTKGEGGFVVGQVTHTWEQDGVSYSLRSVTETTGLAALFKPAKVVQESRGEVVAEGLRPREFRHERVNGLDTASFDWPAQTLAYGGQKEALPAGTQDMLSMYYQLALQKPRVTTELPIATGRKLERYRFEFLGEETLAGARASRRALHLRTNLGAPGGNDAIELWIAVEGQGLPLKIRFIDRKGEIFDQVVEELAGETS